MIKWDDPRVCSFFIAGFCPHEALHGTNKDVGEFSSRLARIVWLQHTRCRAQDGARSCTTARRKWRSTGLALRKRHADFSVGSFPLSAGFDQSERFAATRWRWSTGSIACGRKRPQVAVWTQYVKFTEELIVKAVCWSEQLQLLTRATYTRPQCVHLSCKWTADNAPRQHRCNSDGPRAEAPREPLASIHPTCRRALVRAKPGGCGRRHCCQHAKTVIGQAIAYRLQDKEGRANGIKLDGGGLDGRELRQEVVSCTW